MAMHYSATINPGTDQHCTPQNRYYYHSSSKPLNFHQAMNDFQFMFPEIDKHVIETVLRANNGFVQGTIDQLLILQESALSEMAKVKDDNNSDLLSDRGIIGYSGEEPPPAYSLVCQEFEKRNKRLSGSEEFGAGGNLPANNHWNAPLVGPLPDDFLRITEIRHSLNIETNSTPKLLTLFNELSLEDDKLSTYLQNEEFLRELQQNLEFISLLEDDHRRALGINNATTEVSELSIESQSKLGAEGFDEAVFKQKLKHMGKSTKKKLRKMAQKFSCKNTNLQEQYLNSYDSTFNLLQNDAQNQFVDDSLGCIHETCVNDDEEYDNELMASTPRH